MAAFHGKQGRVTWDYVGPDPGPESGVVSNVLSWSIEASCDVTEGTIMNPVAVTAATHWKDYTASYSTWTATVECFADDGGLDPDLDTDLADDDGAALVLYEGIAAMGVRKYSGTAILTDVSPSVDKDEHARLTYIFQGSGALAVGASDYPPT